MTVPRSVTFLGCVISFDTSYMASKVTYSLPVYEPDQYYFPWWYKPTFKLALPEHDVWTFVKDCPVGFARFTHERNKILFVDLDEDEFRPYSYMRMTNHTHLDDDVIRHVMEQLVYKHRECNYRCHRPHCIRESQETRAPESFIDFILFPNNIRLVRPGRRFAHGRFE